MAISAVSTARPVRIPITRPCTAMRRPPLPPRSFGQAGSPRQAVQAFEQALAEYTGARHAIVVSNCTAALHLALVAAGVGPGDEVIVPRSRIRLGKRHPPRRRDPRLRGHRPGHLQRHT